MAGRNSDLLQGIIDANGGLQYWEGVQSISVTCVMSGITLARKGYPGLNDVKAVIDAKTQKVTFERFGNICGTFTPEQTQVGIVGSQAPLDIRHKPRDAFKGHERTTQWDSHNLIYFAGYAFWYYFNLPFFLYRHEIQTQEMESHRRDNGEIWRVLQVVFPDGFATHTKIQRLYFDEEYRLRRMDYHVDILAGLSDPIPARHYCYDHNVFGNLIAPTLRMITLYPPSMSHVCSFMLQGIEVEINKVVDKS